MADISEITLGQTTYNIKDPVVREKIGQPNGIAELNGNGKVPASQLPSYVDDIVNGYYHEGDFYEDDTYQTLITPTTGKIYYDLATGKQYRWNDVVYVEVKDTQPMTASDVSYSNTNSTLSSDNVQGAIDELDRKIYDAGNYETVLLTVKSTSSSFSPVGQTITVTLAGGETMDFEVDSSLSITFTVQKGITYTITGTSTADYRCVPLSARASLNVRNLTINYVPVSVGVFILMMDGSYITRAEFNPSTMINDAAGVLVLDNGLISAKHGIAIAKNVTTQNKTSWSGQTSTSTTSYNGLSQTISMAQGGAECATWCYGLRLSLDNKDLIGFIGSYAEGRVVYLNTTEINMCLAAIGGNSIPTDGNYRTSTFKVNYAGMRYYIPRSTDNNAFCNESSYKTLPFYYYEL